MALCCNKTEPKSEKAKQQSHGFAEHDSPTFLPMCFLIILIEPLKQVLFSSCLL